ncbi:MAG TPA: IclR family transcriptional regulator C-terminal domain-containing protein [Gaiellaceae bacterium]|nr:IclR family transcriptional regulator C-terminal domain-containing protein [Gaiellaceae bacterium]
MRTSVHMLEQAPGRNPDYVQSLERGLAVIRAFGADRRELRLSDVARATGLTRAAARRFLLTLVRLGYVQQNGSNFSLRPRVLELGYAYLSALSLPEVAQPHMETLVAEVNESSSIAVLDDLEIVYVARVPTQRIMTITIAVGTRLPAYATSMGRVLLAGLDADSLYERLSRMQIERLTPTTAPDVNSLRERIDAAREAGWAAVDQELEQGVRSAAVPIRDASGAVAAALNVSVHATRMTMQALRRNVVPRLLRTAEAIEVDLSAAGSPGASGAA